MTLPEITQRLVDLLKGRKTYMVAIVIAVLGVAESQGWFAAPDWVWPIAGALGLTTVRAGVTAVSAAVTEHAPKSEP